MADKGRQLTVLFVSSAHKGDAMIREVKRMGCHVLLLTEEKLRGEPWPRESIDEMFYIPELARYTDVIHAVSYMFRGMVIDLILPLDEFEVEIVAFLREHLRLPGMGVTAARYFRDKLIMRERTRQSGILVPDFIQILNYDRLREYMDAVPPPWVLKPRSEAGSMGLKKIHSSEELWRSLDNLGDKQSYYLLEKYIPGDVFHVDSLTVNGKVTFTSVQKYGKPPMDVYQGGGIFTTRVLPHSSKDSKALVKLNEQVLKSLGMQNGATHAEYIKAHEDGRFYFLEVAARVGGANISDLIEHATGINLWREWGNLEIKHLRGEKYELPEPRPDYGGLLVSLAKQEFPDMSAYNDPEITWRQDKPYHAGLIVVSPDQKRVEELLDSYSRRFVNDFMAVGVPMGATRTGSQG
jgi:biotin carboxylase